MKKNIWIFLISISLLFNHSFLAAKKNRAEKHPNAPQKTQKVEKGRLDLYPKSIDLNDQEANIELYFQDAQLSNFVDYIADLFKITIITDDIFENLPSNQQNTLKNIKGGKITFKNNIPMTKKETWELFLTFMDIAGFAVIKNNNLNIYRIVSGDPKIANKMPLPSFIGLKDLDLIPDNDQKIRFLYFVENADFKSISNIVQSMVSNVATFKPFNQLRAFLITDKAANIKSLMKVVLELDKVSMPESLSVIKLKKINVNDFIKLYQSLVSKEDPSKAYIRNIIGAKKEPSATYFPENLKLVGDIRSNSLIVLGPADGIKKLEDFIIKHIDIDLDVPYSPLWVYTLQYTNAEDMANLLTNITKPPTPTKGSAPVRYFGPTNFQADKTGNKLIIKAEETDYPRIRNLIEKLDVIQPQVAIDILIVSVSAGKYRSLGTQIRNKADGYLTSKLDVQTSGLRRAEGLYSGIETQGEGNQTTLLGNLIKLATGQEVGSTLLTLGSDFLGVWGVFKILNTITKTNIISNPFLITTNKYEATATIGETRWLKTGEIQGVTSSAYYGYKSANLAIKITPQINPNEIIDLKIDITSENFTSDQEDNASKNTKEISTSARLANKEILVIGGILQDKTSDLSTKTPILGSIPLIGWIFKNKFKSKTKDNVLIFISPRIIKPKFKGGYNKYTKSNLNFAKNAIEASESSVDKRDPIYRWFFKNPFKKDTEKIEKFLEKSAKENNKYLENFSDKKTGEKK